MWAINKKHDQYSYCTVDGDLYGGSSHSDLWRNWLRKKKMHTRSIQVNHIHCTKIGDEERP